jgi:hypothetical protein
MLARHQPCGAAVAATHLETKSLAQHVRDQRNLELRMIIICVIADPGRFATVQPTKAIS